MSTAPLSLAPACQAAAVAACVWPPGGCVLEAALRRPRQRARWRLWPKPRADRPHRVSSQGFKALMQRRNLCTRHGHAKAAALRARARSTRVRSACTAGAGGTACGPMALFRTRRPLLCRKHTMIAAHRDRLISTEVNSSPLETPRKNGGDAAVESRHAQIWTRTGACAPLALHPRNARRGAARAMRYPVPRRMRVPRPKRELGRHRRPNTMYMYIPWVS